MNKTRLFEYDYEFTTRDAVDGPTRDLAFRITKVLSSAPVSWIMSDVFFVHDGDSTFCEAYTDTGNPAIAVGQDAAKLIPGIKERPVLHPGATIFLRDIPEAWWNSQEVVEKLATLIESCCQQDEVALSREHLAEAVKLVFDQMDLGERLLRRGRTDLRVDVSWHRVGEFLIRVMEADASVLTVLGIDRYKRKFSTIVLVADSQAHHFSDFTPR